LMGHEGYLTEVYRRYTIEDLREFYLKGESALLVFTDAAEVTKLRQEVEEYAHKIQKEVDERNKTLQTLVNGLTTENLDMKSKVAKVELENMEIKKGNLETKAELKELSLTVRSLVKKLEKLTEA